MIGRAPGPATADQLEPARRSAPAAVGVGEADRRPARRARRDRRDRAHEGPRRASATCRWRTCARRFQRTTAIALVPEAIARAHTAIPLRTTDHGLQVAMVEPTDAKAIADLESAAGLPVLPVIAPASDIRRAMEKAYRALASVGRHIEAFLATEALNERSSEEQDDADAAPVVQVVQPDHHAGRARPRIRHPHRAAGLARADPLPDRRRPARRARAPREHGAGRREPREGARRHEHRRAPPPAGRPDRDGGRRPPARRARRDHHDDLGREGRPASARQEPRAASPRRARDARGDAYDVLEARSAPPSGS